MNLQLELTKRQIVDLFAQLRLDDNVNADEFSDRLEKIITGTYDMGREQGMVEALNFMSDKEDRERLFKGLEDLRKEIYNE